MTPAEKRELTGAETTRLVIANARSHRDWPELGSEDVERRGPFVVDRRSGRLYTEVRGAVYGTSGDGHGGVRVHEIATLAVDAFYVTDAGAVFLTAQTREPRTLADLDAAEADRERRHVEQRERNARAARARSEALAAQPLVPVTMAAVEGRPLPTIAEAARRITELHGTIGEHDGRLTFELPESVAAKMPGEISDALRVLVGAREVVLACLASSSSKNLVDRLPARRVGPDGALVT
jgi:hypothetical protein